MPVIHQPVDTPVVSDLGTLLTCHCEHLCVAFCAGMRIQRRCWVTRGLCLPTQGTVRLHGGSGILHPLPAMHEGSHLSTASPTGVVPRGYFSHPGGREAASHCGFDSHLLMRHLCMCVLAIRVSSLEKCLFSSFAHCKNWVVCLFMIFSRYKPLIRYLICRNVLPFCGCLFTFLVVSFETQKS